MLTDSDNIRPTTTASVCQSILTIKKRRQTIVCCRCDSYRIQTCNLLIRSQMLYSVELMSHCRFGFATAKLGLFFLPAKLFCLFFQALLPPQQFGSAYALWFSPLVVSFLRYPYQRQSSLISRHVVNTFRLNFCNGQSINTLNQERTYP